MNVAATAPIFALAKIHSAKRAAQVAGDLARVRRLDAYQNATITIAMSMGVALTAIQIPEAYKDAKDLFGETPVKKTKPAQTRP